MADKKKFENNLDDFHDRFINHSTDDNEIFSPVHTHSNDSSIDKIDWLDQYTNAYRIAEENIEFMRKWLLKIPFHDLLTELKHNYIGRICHFTTETDRYRVEEFINQAIDKQTVKYLIQAYTANTTFFYQLNKDLARRGSKFRFTSSKVDGQYDDEIPLNLGEYIFTACLIHHPSVDIYYKSYRKTYRGMNITQSELEKYVPGARILIRSFLSTSRKTSVASMYFNLTYGDKIPVLCIYSITQSRTALDISEISEFPQEEEILIRPFAVFCVEKVEKNSFSYDEKNKITQILLNELPSTTERWKTLENQSPITKKNISIDIEKSSTVSSYSLINNVRESIEEILPILSRHVDIVSSELISDFKFIKSLIKKYSCLDEFGSWVNPLFNQFYQTILAIKQILYEKENEMIYDEFYLKILFTRVQRRARNMDFGVNFSQDGPFIRQELKYETILDERRKHYQIPESLLTLNQRFSIETSIYIQQCIDLHSYIRVLGIGKDNFEQFVTRIDLLPLTSTEKEHVLQKCDPLVIPLRSFVSFTIDHQFSSEEDQRRSLMENIQQPIVVNDSRTLYQLVAETPFLPSLKSNLNTSFSNSEISVSEISSILDKHRWIVILGDPGSAKTTLVRWLILQCAKNFLHNQLTRLPILARVGELASALDQNPNLSLIDYFCQLTWFGTSLIKSSNDGQFIREYIKHGHAFIILDGLDEIPNFRQRQHIVRLIEQFLQEWTVCPVTFVAPLDETVLTYTTRSMLCSTVGNQVIITSRIVGYYMCPITSIHIEHYTLNLMTLSTMNSFIDHWFISVHSSLEISEPKSNRVMTRMNADADRLKSMLINNEDLRKLISNPMMLAVLCTLTLLQTNEEEIEHLRKQRLCLLHKMSEFTLRSYLPLSNKYDVFMHFFIDIALYLHEHSSSGLIEELDMKNVLRRSANINEEIINDFIHLIDSETCLFLPRGLCIYGFSHLMFEEYYVCLHILEITENIEMNDSYSKSVANRFHRYIFSGSRFREPLILALSYISWQWPEIEYHSFCTYLLNENDSNRFSQLTALGAICLLLSIQDLIRLPSKQILTIMLNQCIQASAIHEWFKNFPTMAGILQTAMNELPATFVQEWFLTVNDNIIETMSQFILQMNTLPKWFDQSMCSHMWNRLISSNHRLTSCLVSFISRFDKTLLPKNDLYRYMMTNELCLDKIHPLIFSIIICLCGGLKISENDENIIEFSSELMQHHSNYSLILSQYLYSDPQALLNYCHNKISSNSTDIPVDILIMCCCLEGCQDKYLTFAFVQRLQQLAIYICSIYIGKVYLHDSYKPNTKQILTLLLPLIDSISHDDLSPSISSIIIIALSRLLSARNQNLRDIQFPHELCYLDEEQLNSELFILSRSYQPDSIPAKYRRLFMSQTNLSTMFRIFLCAAYIIELSIDVYERWCHLFPEDNIQEILTFNVVQRIDVQINIVDEDNRHRLSQMLFKCQTFIDVNVTKILISWLSYCDNRDLREFAYHSALLLFNINSTATIICCQLLSSELDDFRRRAEQLFKKKRISIWHLGQEGLISFIEVCQSHRKLLIPHLFELLTRIRIHVEHTHSLSALYSVLENENLADRLKSFSFTFDPSIQSLFISRLEKTHAATEQCIAILLIIFSRTSGKWNKFEVNRGINTAAYLLRKYANSLEITRAALAVFTRWRSYNYIKHIVLQNHYPEIIRINALRWLYQQGKHRNDWTFVQSSTSKFPPSMMDAAREKSMYRQCTNPTYDGNEPTARFLLDDYSNNHAQVLRILIMLHSDTVNRDYVGSDMISRIFTELCTEHAFEAMDTIFVDTICMSLLKAQNGSFSSLFDTQLICAVQYAEQREMEFFRAVRDTTLGEQGFKQALYSICKKHHIQRRLAALKLLVHYAELTIEIAEIFFDFTREKFTVQQDACQLIWRLKRIPNRQLNEYLLDQLRNDSLQKRYMASLLLVQLAVNDQISTNTVFKHIRNVINAPTSIKNVYITAEFFNNDRHSMNVREGRLDQALVNLLMQFSLIAGNPHNNEYRLYSHYNEFFLQYDLLFEQIRMAPRSITCHIKPSRLPVSVDDLIDQAEHDFTYINL